MNLCYFKVISYAWIKTIFLPDGRSGWVNSFSFHHHTAGSPRYLNEYYRNYSVKKEREILKNNMWLKNCVYPIWFKKKQFLKYDIHPILDKFPHEQKFWYSFLQCTKYMIKGHYTNLWTLYISTLLCKELKRDSCPHENKEEVKREPNVLMKDFASYPSNFQTNRRWFVWSRLAL